MSDSMFLTPLQQAELEVLAEKSVDETWRQAITFMIALLRTGRPHAELIRELEKLHDDGPVGDTR